MFLSPKENKDSSYVLDKQMKKMMKLATKTHKTVETLKATVEATNKTLRKTNANLSQLWVAGK